jgi:molecular chaperone HscB
MIEPFPPGTDYFAALGLPRRLQIDRADLERRYHDLSRRFHPDFFQTASPRERLISLENSALLNKAYRTLRDPIARAEYLVKLEGGEAEMKAEPPQALFEEILELNELLSDFKLADPDEQASLRPRLEEEQRRFSVGYEALQRRLTEELFPAWDRALGNGASADGGKQSLLSDMGRLIGNRAYLRRVLNNLEEALSPIGSPTR